MPEDKKPPAYVGVEAPLNVPPIQVLTEPPPKKKFHIPLWMIILLGVCFWFSTMATIAIYFISNKKEASAIQQPVVTVIITETPAPLQRTTQTIVNSKKLLTNTQFSYSIETPTTWKMEEEPTRVWLYEEAATSKDQPLPYLFARVLVSYETKTKLKVVPWFDLQYPSEFGLANAPVKKKLYVNRNGVEMLETQVKDPNGRLRYYFLANGQIVGLTFNTTNSEETNKRLQVLYGQIIDSVKLLKPSQ